MPRSSVPLMLVRGLKRSVEKLTGTRILRTLPHGTNLFRDIENELPAWRAEMVFDVGANVGQSAERFLDAFPAAELYCFEPMPQTFAELDAKLPDEPRVHRVQLALGASRGTGAMKSTQSRSTGASLVPSMPDASSRDEDLVTVTVEPLDGFCAAEGIEHIGYLKIDTEGHDLEVLKGADRMLGDHRIDIVQVEAGMNRDNRLHVPLEHLKRHLEDRDYWLFGVYDQVLERPTQEARLRRANLLFVSEHVMGPTRP